MRKIRKNDEVQVITGKDKGKNGRVLNVDSDHGRVLVENINIVKRHTKGNPQQNKPGGIIEKEMSIHISNVKIVNPMTGKTDRVGFRTLEDGRKVRVLKSNNEVLDS